MRHHQIGRAFSLAVALLLGCHVGALAQDEVAESVAGEAEYPTSKEVIGWLKANPRQSGSAPYSLLDSSGAVRYYLWPSPGVPLQRYINNKVRVRGEETLVSDHPAPLLKVNQAGPPEIALNDDAPLLREEFATRGGEVQRAAAIEPSFDPQRFVTPASASVPRRLSQPRIIRTNFAEEKLVPQPSNDGYADETTTADSSSMSFDDSCGGCDSCSLEGCDGCCGNACGIPGCAWVRAEYLYWWTQGMNLPPLVTTGPSVEQPGYIGSPGTVILFGNERVNGFGRSGGRLTAGFWLDPCRTVGIEGQYIGLGSATTNYSATSSGIPILSRPFFDTRPSLADQNVEQVASPGNLAGTVSSEEITRFTSAGVWLRKNLCCCNTCFDEFCCPTFNGAGGSRLDFLIGYRYLRLTDSATVNENLVSLNSEFPGSFLVNDSFKSWNQFNGIDFGTSWMGYRGQWGLELLSKIALGNNNQIVRINGSTSTTQDGQTTVDQGGLLALSSNIGQYKRNQFCVVPELGANLTYQFAPRLRFVVGYTFIYWSRVARAGNQIDTDVNSTLLPNSPTPPTGDLRHPQFVYRDTDFWAQGINLGIDFRF